MTFPLLHWVSLSGIPDVPTVARLQTTHVRLALWVDLGKMQQNEGPCWYVVKPLEELRGSLADRAGFEPAVAVTPRTLSKRVP